MTLKEWLTQTRQGLAAISDTAQLDAEILLANCLSVNKSYLYTWPEKSLTDQQLQQLDVWLALRLQGQPIAYIVGHREFWSLDFKVNDACLIPRPETELLVEQCLQALPETEQFVLELGTGSGAIAIALAYERPLWQILASDRSEKALTIAKQNAQNLAVTNVKFCSSDWFQQLENQQFAAIISNPPYIEKDDPHLLQGDVRFEPPDALVAEDNGLAALQTIIETAPKYLLQKGLLALEHGYQQAAQVQQLMTKYGFLSVSSHRDLAGHERVTTGRLAKKC